jgi:hypothetical protein
VAGEPLSQTLRELGFRGLTKGTSATLLRDVPFNMVRGGSRLLAEKLYTDPGIASLCSALMCWDSSAGSRHSRS